MDLLVPVAGGEGGEGQLVDLPLKEGRGLIKILIFSTQTVRSPYKSLSLDPPSPSTLKTK